MFEKIKMNSEQKLKPIAQRFTPEILDEIINIFWLVLGFSASYFIIFVALFDILANNFHWVITPVIFCIPPIYSIIFSAIYKSKNIAAVGSILVLFWAYNRIGFLFWAVLAGNFNFAGDIISVSAIVLGLCLIQIAVLGVKARRVGRTLTPDRNRSKRIDHGEARFANPVELAAMNQKPAGMARSPVLLGKVGHLDLAAELAGLRAPFFQTGGDEYLRWYGEGSMLAVAPSGTGKTAALVVPNLLFNRAAVVALDVKGELATITTMARKAMGHTVAQIAPFAEANEEKSSSINVLDYVRSGKFFDSDCKDVAASLVLKSSSADNSAHFEENARSIVAGIISLVVDASRRSMWPFIVDPTAPVPPAPKEEEAGAENNEYSDDELSLGEEEVITENNWPYKEPPSPSLPGVYDILATSPEDFDKLMNLVIKDSNKIGGALTRNAASVWLRVGSDEKGSFYSTLMRYVSTYSDDAVREVTTESSIDLNNLVNKENTLDLFISIPFNLLPQHSAIARSIFATCVNIVMQKNKNKIENEVLFMLDEMPTIGGIDAILDPVKQTGALTVGRSYGMRFMGFVQSISQIEAAYGPLGVKTWKSVECFIAFKIPRTDKETAELLSDMLGTFTAVIETTGISANDEKGFSFDNTKGKSVNTQDIARKLLTPDEVAGLPDDAVVVLLNSSAGPRWPILCVKANYFEQAGWNGFYVNPRLNR